MKILIADDETLARERLKALLAELPNATVVGEASHGAEAVALAQSLQADCVLLDIAMPQMDGLAAAECLGRSAHPPAVIFCTAYDAHALAAFEANGIDYLLKPVRKERLAAALEKARRFLQEAPRERPNHAEPAHLTVRDRGALRVVPVSEILYLQAEDKYVAIRTARQRFLTDDSLNALEKKLIGRFVRIHRACLVAITEIAALAQTRDGKHYLELKNAEERLEVSRRNLPTLRQSLKMP